MRSVCSNYRCHWCGDYDAALTAQDPFIPGETLRACPSCRGQTLEPACDVSWCKQRASSWTPIPGTGTSRAACHEHSDLASTSGTPENVVLEAGP